MSLSRFKVRQARHTILCRSRPNPYVLGSARAIPDGDGRYVDGGVIAVLIVAGCEQQKRIGKTEPTVDSLLVSLEDSHAPFGSGTPACACDVNIAIKNQELRNRAQITDPFLTSSSRHLQPLLNREIRDVE